MNRKYVLLILGVLIMPVALAARDLSMSDALKLAEDHSYKIKADRLQADAFRSGLEAAVAERLPTLSATGVASYKDKIAQLDVALPTGDILRREIGSKENYQVDLRLSLPIFTGGRVSGGVDIARATRDYYDAAARATLDQVLLAARVEFLQLYRVDMTVEAARAALLRANTTMRDVQSLFDAGAADSINILDASIAVTDARSRLDNALSLRRQNEIALSIMLGIDPDESITLMFSPKPPSESALSELTIDSTKPELLAAGSAVAMSRYLIKVNRADLLPTVSVFGGYSWGKPNIDLFHDEFNDYFTFGATANWSFNFGGKSVKKIRQAQSQYKAAEYELSRTREKLDQTSRIVHESLKLAYDNYQTALSQHSIASDNYRLANQKHREGVLSSNRLIEIEATLSMAEASLAAARADFYIVQSQYYQATGSDLLKEGI